MANAGNPCYNEFTSVDIIKIMGKILNNGGIENESGCI